jgi:acyl-CoA synthetase (AMP-forming)/AMP-acid ligase II
VTTARLALRIVRALWRSGLLRLSPVQALRVLGAWWRCGSSLAALAAFAAVRFPDRCALHDEDGPLTFGELVASGDALASSLHADHGLRAGQQAALLCRNHRGFVVGVLALGRLGVDVLVLSSDSPGRALRRIFERQPVALVLHDAELAPLLATSAPQLRRCRVDLPAGARPRRALPRVRRAGQLVVLTSGSTGVPKGVRRRPTLASVLPTVAGLLDGLPLRMHRPAVLAIPLHHGYGLTTLAMTLAMAAPLHLGRRFAIAPLLARLPEDAAAVLVSVPTLLRRWLRQRPASPRLLLAAVVSGSAPLDAGLCLDLLDACGPVLFNLYGSTEAGVMAMATPAELRAAPGTVGRPLPGTAVRLLDGAGRPVEAGAMGRIQVRGPLVLRPAANGWLDTGDLGRLDTQGRLFVCGRADAMFVSGGENVYPEETEATLATHPALADAAVTVVPDAEFGQRMLAWVVPRAGCATLDEVVLRDWLRERLERYQLPRRIALVPRIPRNALGKIDRPALATLQAPDERAAA